VGVVGRALDSNLIVRRRAVNCEVPGAGWIFRYSSEWAKGEKPMRHLREAPAPFDKACLSAATHRQEYEHDEQDEQDEQFGQHE
jgi:hypothetical protein